MNTIDYASLPAGTIADELGIHYFGDCSAIPHDGYFYSLDDYAFGYVSAVEFCSGDGKLWITSGTISILEGDELTSMLRQMGEGDGSDNPHAVVAACKSLWGVEPTGDYGGGHVREFAYVDDYDRHALRLPLCFDPDGDCVPEFRDSATGDYLTESQVWESVSGWLKGLQAS